MAIVEMKRLRLIVPRPRREELLRELMRMGCVEVSELDVAASELEGLVKKEETRLEPIRKALTRLDGAVDILERYAPAKKRRRRGKALEDSVLLNDTGIKGALQAAGKINSYEQRIRAIRAEENRISTLITALEPWTVLDMPLKLRRTERCEIFIGTMPAAVELAEVERALYELSDMAELFTLSEDKSLRYVLFVCLRKDADSMGQCLRRFGFMPATFTDIDCSAREYISRMNARLRELAQERADCIAFIADERVRREPIKLAADRVRIRLDMEQAGNRLYGTESCLVMEGWLPADRAAEAERALLRLGCACEIESPAVEEYPQVPVKLNNNALTNSMNMITNTYGLPSYGSVDPNPLMAPFFILFYGLMMADMGYGALMMIASVIAMLKLRPKDGALSFCQLLGYCGVSTFIVGAMTGGFFGDALVKIGQLTGRPEGWGSLPYLFSPLNDTIYVLFGAVALGLIQLNAGLAAGFAKKLRRKQLADAVFEEGALWIILIGIALFVLGIGSYRGVPVVLTLGIVMLFYGGTRGKKGFGKLLSLFATLYNTSTGWFGDILSYTRIMALMLAGTVISTVFNTIGAIANSLWLFVPVFIIGHTLNFALNLLGCYVHDLRLQCLEYFGKFYEEGGRAFEPLEIKPKYHELR